jgi:hypothetical protein
MNIFGKLTEVKVELTDGDNGYRIVVWADKGFKEEIESMEGVNSVFGDGRYSVFVDHRYDPKTIGERIGRHLWFCKTYLNRK